MLRGELTPEQATQQMKFATHQYAKRQLTWFRRDARITWLSAPTVEDVLRVLHR
jgi:tRNA dimethylallyltransferase